MAFPLNLSVARAMSKQTTHNNIVFVDKTKATLVVLPEKNVKVYTYPQDMVIDGDVLRRDDFKNAFAHWLEESQIKPVDTMLIVSLTALFEKAISPPKRSRVVDTKLINAFVDAIPIQHVAMIKRPGKEGSVTVIAANRDLLMSIYLGLDKAGCSVVGIFPEIAPLMENATPVRQGDIIAQAQRHLAAYSGKKAIQEEFDILPQTHKNITQMSVAEAAQQPVQPWVAVAMVALLVVGAFGIGYYQYFQARQEQVALARKRAQLLAQQQSVSNTQNTGTQPVSAQASSTAATSSAIPDQLVTPSIAPPKGSPPPTVLEKVQIIYTKDAQVLFDTVYNKLRNTGAYQISNQMTNRTLLENRLLIPSALSASSAARIQSVVESSGITTVRNEATLDGYDMVIELGVYAPGAPSSPTLTQSP